jgi:hypothetical protein
MTWKPFAPPPRRAAAEPRSVRHDGERAALAVRALHEMFEATPTAEAAAWARLQPASRPPRFSLLTYAAALACTAAVAVVVAVFVGPRHGMKADESPGALAESAPSTERVPAPGLPAPAALAPGPTALPGGLRAQLRGSARASWVATSPQGGHVVLADGMLELEADAPVDVRVAAFRVAGSAGRYRITARRGGVDVVVEKGEAAVWSSVRVIKRVVAGERWSSPELADQPAIDEPAPAPSPRAPARGAPAHGHRAEPSVASAAPPGEAAVVESRDCLRLARDGVTDAAIECFQSQTARPGLTGEIALLELARIRRDVKGDLTGAERLLAEHRRRFPHSALAAEARTLHVELLLRLDQPAEALAEAERLGGAEAIFWRAACLARLGRRDEARRAYDDYLGRDGIERRGDATRKRAALDD